MTLAQIQDSLIDNADFEEVQSVAKAKAFVTAAKRWFILSPQSASKDGASLSLNSQQIQLLMTRAQEFIRANDASGRPRVSFLAVRGRE